MIRQIILRHPFLTTILSCIFSVGGCDEMHQFGYEVSGPVSTVVFLVKLYDIVGGFFIRVPNISYTSASVKPPFTGTDTPGMMAGSIESMSKLR